MIFSENSEKYIQLCLNTEHMPEADHAGGLKLKAKLFRSKRKVVGWFLTITKYGILCWIFPIVYSVHFHHI
jgi:hypothetical protein